MGIPRIISSGKMSASAYNSLHHWVEKQLGKAQKCDKCKTTEKKIYDWANLSGEYKKDITDWARLCRTCHIRMDLTKTECIRGHQLTDDNLYIRPNGDRDCRACKVKYMREFYLRKKQEKS